jgi:AraC-like DNA-binding protein
MTSLFAIGNSHQPVVSTAGIANIKPPYVHFKRQYHEYILYYILDGEMFLKEGDTSYHLKENDMLLLEPALIHQGEQASVCRFLYVHFSWENLFAAPATPSMQDAVMYPKYHHFAQVDSILNMQDLTNRLVNCFFQTNRFNAMMSSCLLAQLLLVAASDYQKTLYEKHSPVSGKAKQILPKLIAYLEQSYAETISSDSLEEMFHYNFDYLNRQFKKWTGETIFVYLNTVRIKRARQLLSTGFYSIAEVAELSGFRDVYYFSRVFKKYTGTTPGWMKEDSAHSS